MAVERFLESNSEIILDYFIVPTSFGLQMFYTVKRDNLDKIKLESYISNDGDLGLRPYDIKESDFYTLKNKLETLEDWWNE